MERLWLFASRQSSNLMMQAAGDEAWREQDLNLRHQGDNAPHVDLSSAART